MSKDKPKVGDILYSLNIGNAARYREQSLSEVVVTKVGRKYFYAKKPDHAGHMTVKYCIDSWWEATDYSPNSKLYGCAQDYYDEKEAGKICRLIYNSFEYSKNKFDISLGDLRTIESILINNGASHE